MTSNIRLNKDMHYHLKIKAAETEKTMQQLVELALMEYFKNEEKGKTNGN